MPKVSVIIPAYNSEKYIARTIQSVLAQSFTDYEIIVIDDGSTDNTKEIIAQFGNRVQYLAQQNKGPSVARNLGIEKSSGQYLAFLDHDDVFLKDKLLIQSRVLDNEPDVGLVTGWLKFIDDEGTPLSNQMSPSNDYFTLRDFLNTDPILTPSLPMVRRSVLDQIGVFDTEFWYTSDYEMWVRIAAHGWKVKCVQDFILNYRIHPRNLSKSMDLMYQGSFAILDKVYALSNLPADVIAMKANIYAKNHVGFGLNACFLNNTKAATEHFEKAIQYNPESFNNRDTIIQAIVDYLLFALSNADEAEPAVDRILAGVEPVVKGITKAKSKLIGLLYAGFLFREHEHRQYEQVRSYFFKTVLADPKWLSNRGFVSIGLRSLFKNNEATPSYN